MSTITSVHAVLQQQTTARSAREIGADAGCTGAAAREAMRKLCAQGLCAKTQEAGGDVRWGTPEQVMAHDPQAVKRARDRVAEYARTKRGLTIENVTQRRVSAAEAEPIRPRVPASVFTLGAA
jgi:hypothetical protein